MNPFHFLLRFQPSGALAEVMQQARSGPPGGWILLILLILALVILWWLLGPGAKRRRRKMADLPKPAQTSPSLVAKPAASAGLPISQAAAPLAKQTPSVSAAKADEPAKEEAEDTMADEAAAGSSAADEEVADVEDASVVEASAVEASAAGEDNLRRIEGIGPKAAGILAANGVATFVKNR